MAGKLKVQYLSPRELKVPDVRITSAFDEEIYAMFAEDVKVSGINQPLLVAKDGEDLWVVDGKNRRDQALLQGISTVPCVVREMSLKDVQLRNLVLNTLRGRTKASEEVKLIKDLYDTFKVGIDEITTRTGMKRERVEQLLHIGSADPEIWSALDHGQIKVCHAYQLARLVDRSAQLRMLNIALQYRMPCKDLQEAIDETLKIIAERKKKDNPGAAPIAPPIPTATCSICKADYPVRELSSPIICRTCYSTLIMAYETGKREYEAEQTKIKALAEQAAGTPAKPEGGS
jgi:ParB/RepB/Spo0J family partition protein